MVLSAGGLRLISPLSCTDSVQACELSSHSSSEHVDDGQVFAFFVCQNVQFTMLIQSDMVLDVVKS